MILIVTAVFPPEPVVSARLSYDLACELSKTHDVTVLCPAPSRPSGFNFEGTPDFSFEVKLMKSYTCPKFSLIGRMRESWSFGKKCSRFITDNYSAIDLIYFNAWPLFAQYSITKTAGRFGIKTILHLQDIYPESISNKLPLFGSLINLFLLPLDKYILRHSGRVIAISEKMKIHIVNTRKINPAKVEVVRNWQDENTFTTYQAASDSTTQRKEPFTFMYLGNIGPVAGIDLLIDAFSTAGLQNCRLVIAGSGSMKESLRKKVDMLNFGNVEFWQVPEGKVAEIQYEADILLLPVKKNAAGSSVPSKLPAYMFSAKPVIACVDESSDTAEAILTSECGWVLPPENKDRLAEMMIYASKQSTAELIRKGENGYEFAVLNYTRNKNLQSLIEIIEGIV